MSEVTATMTTTYSNGHIRARIHEILHLSYGVRSYDNSRIWAGNLKLWVEDESHSGAIARVFFDTEAPTPITVRVTAEIYISGITDVMSLSPSDLDVMIWTDANMYGFTDQKGIYHPDYGTYIPMSLHTDADGIPVRVGNNALYISDPITIEKPGVFSYTAMFSADHHKPNHPAKEWISINDISYNRDGLIVVVPAHLRACPSTMEICVRKYGASRRDDVFTSGRIANITRDIANIPVDILYLLPIFEPGTTDILTGADVRKGDLGSIYASKDFFRIDPAICTPPAEADILSLVEQGLIEQYDLRDLIPGRKAASLSRISEFNRFDSNREVVEFLGEDTATQLIGRAELRQLTRAAHALGKKVIFDLVLMQTSRDSHLILEHRDWYALDENGAPKKHSIAWLDYSDVALFDLTFNKPLQNYLSGVAPYWIKTCGLDGVRIDASQTVDTGFLKQIKNRIDEIKPDAIVLGETLCSFDEAINVPTDMIYSLLVDHHVNIEYATPYFDLFESYHHTFPHNTIAIAYFENHDSKRATAHWRDHFTTILACFTDAIDRWKIIAGPKAAASPVPLMTALKNIQCTLINTFSGSADRVNFAPAIENGTDFAETTRTDFENSTTLDFTLRDSGINATLHKAYGALHTCKNTLSKYISCGHVYYHRENLAPEHADRVFALTRYTDNDHSTLLFLSNLDPLCPHAASYKLDYLKILPAGKYRFDIAFDTYAEMGLTRARFKSAAPTVDGATIISGDLTFTLQPLQSLVIIITPVTARNK